MTAEISFYNQDSEISKGVHFAVSDCISNSEEISPDKLPEIRAVTQDVPIGEYRSWKVYVFEPKQLPRDKYACQLHAIDEANQILETTQFMLTVLP